MRNSPGKTSAKRDADARHRRRWFGLRAHRETAAEGLHRVVPDGTIPPAMLAEAQSRQALLNIPRNAREPLEAHRGEVRRVRMFRWSRY